MTKSALSNVVLQGPILSEGKTCEPILHDSPISTARRIEVHGFKWPRRPTSITMASVLGEDEFGCWLGVARGQPWWTADQTSSGVMENALVKLVPPGTFWSCCFHLEDPIVDVDIILPVQWKGDLLEEVDLELDILGYADGRVEIRDQDQFNHVREVWSMPENIVTQVELTCAHIHSQVKDRIEPFRTVGKAWLTTFINKTGTTDEHSRI